MESGRAGLGSSWISDWGRYPAEAKAKRRELWALTSGAAAPDRGMAGAVARAALDVLAKVLAIPHNG